MSVRYLTYRSIGATGASSSPRTVHDSRDETGETTRVTSTLPPQALLPGRLQITTSRKHNQRPRHPVSDIKDTHPGTPDNDRIVSPDLLPVRLLERGERQSVLAFPKRLSANDGRKRGTLNAGLADVVIGDKLHLLQALSVRGLSHTVEGAVRVSDSPGST
jgi:hypothetical protein